MGKEVRGIEAVSQVYEYTLCLQNRKNKHTMALTFLNQKMFESECIL